MPGSSGRVAALGAEVQVQVFALAGALVVTAGDAAQARAAWRTLPPDVSVVVLTKDAAGAVSDLVPGSGRLTVVMS